MHSEHTKTQRTAGSTAAQGSSRLAAPQITLTYVRTLTDDTGMIQHGIGGVPDPHTGYSTDDNARALLAMVRLWRGAPDRRAEVEPLLVGYVRFMLYAQQRNTANAGWFVNFFAYDRNPMEPRGTEDCLGRCIWALAESASGDLPLGAILSVRQMLQNARPLIPQLKSPHAVAYALLGLCRLPGAENDPQVRSCIDFLSDHWRNYSKRGWQWFEPQMTYDNARCVEAMLRAALLTGDRRIMKIAVDAMDFLTESSFDSERGYLAPIGNRGWWVNGGEKAAFDQQTLEAGAYTELYRLAAKELGLLEYKKLADRCRDWFLGDNVHRLPLYDYETGGCHDALTADGVNLNQGAESVLSYLLAQGAELEDRISPNRR